MDDLRGLKENVIVGRLIPAGTGMAFHAERRRQRMAEEAPVDVDLAIAEATAAVEEEMAGNAEGVSED